MERPAPLRRDGFRHFSAERPRWNDIDVFGHVNNAEFYAYFDTAVLRFLHAIGAVSAAGGKFAALVVESGARFHREVLFTETLAVGVRVDRLGSSSVRYGIGIFTDEREDASVDGHFVHVFVDRATRRPAPIPDRVRQAFAELAGRGEDEA